MAENTKIEWADRTFCPCKLPMCNRYTTPAEAEIERFWHVGRDNPMPGIKNGLRVHA